MKLTKPPDLKRILVQRPIRPPRRVQVEKCQQFKEIVKQRLQETNLDFIEVSVKELRISSVMTRCPIKTGFLRGFGPSLKQFGLELKKFQGELLFYVSIKEV